MASANASRWLEVDSRLNEAHGLPAEDQDTLKAIGILNLIDADGIMRATPAMIQFALEDPTDTSAPERFTTLQSRLQRLVADGFLVHRSYSDEYRVWQGSDVNIDVRVKENATRITASDVIGYLGKHLGTVLPAAVVAGAHSQRTGMLRYFRTAISHHGEKLDGPEAAGDSADGMMIYHLGTLDMLPVINSDLPVLVGTTKDPATILQAGITLVALEELLHDSALDHVAAREVQERIADMSQEIGSRLDGGFNPGSAQSVWHLWNRGNDISAAPGEIIRKRSYAALVSYACDKIYQHTPHIRNEMLGRHELTSNAARARRELLTAMLRQPNLPVLGFDQNRYTPERAMYHGVLEYLGLHGISEVGTSVTAGDTFTVFAVRRPDSRKNVSAIPVWEALDKVLTGTTQPTPITEINRALMAPPYGVKAGIVPILVISALILHTEDIALFEDGSYCPRLTPEIVERMLSDNGPSRFKVKAAPVGDGQRHLVITTLAAALGILPAPSRSARNPQLLAITRAMLERVVALSPYARHTRRISQQAVAIRGVLSVATDPDELLFSAAPRALGFEPIPMHGRTDEEAATSYIARLTQSLDELTGADKALRQEVASVIGREFRLPSDLAALRCGLTQRLHGFANAPLELPLRGFVTRVLDENLPDEDWLDPIIIRLTNKALGDWTDENAENFQLLVRQTARALDRVSHLYEISDGQGPPAPQDMAAASKPPELMTRLLTLTTPDGTEARTLIHLPEHARAKAEALAADVIEQAKTELGADGGRILLAALAERLTADEHDDPQQAKEKL
jgi:hypothetical protein